MHFLQYLFKIGSVGLTKIVLFLILILLTFATTLFAIFNFVQSRDKIVEVHTEKALGIALTYSGILDGDSIELDLMRREKNKNYDHWKAIGDSTLKKNGLKYLYVMNIDYDGDSIEYYISAEDHMGQINFLDKDDVAEFDVKMIKTIADGNMAQSSSISYTPKYGWLVSSYAPVKNSAGAVVAFVGADRDMENMNSDIKKISIKLFVASFLFMAVVFLLTLLIVREIFIHPIAKIVKAANNFNLLDISFDTLDLTHIKEYDSLIESFKRMEKKIMFAVKKSFTDDLTKLNNRYFFTLSLENILKPTKFEKKIAFLIFDIDYFKQINDNYGHEKGDFVLRSVGAVLNHVFGGLPGAVARLGGDEFAVCLEDFDDRRTIEDKCQTFKWELSQVKYSEDKSGVCASIGVILTKFTTNVPLFSEIFSAADSNLYKVKAMGRNGFEISEL